MLALYLGPWGYNILLRRLTRIYLSFRVAVNKGFRVASNRRLLTLNLRFGASYPIKSVFHHAVYLSHEFK